VEGIYVKNWIISPHYKIRKIAFADLLTIFILISLVGVTWFAGIKPFRAEEEHFKYKKSLVQGKVKEAEKYILKAIELDPHNSAYNLYAGQLYLGPLKDMSKASQFIEKTVIDFNGDLVPWTLYFLRGIVKQQVGSVFEAREAYKIALYYNPVFNEAKQKLAEVEKIIKDHDTIMIKFK